MGFEIEVCKKKLSSFLLSVYFFAFLGVISIVLIQKFASQLTRHDRKETFIKKLLFERDQDDPLKTLKQNTFGDADRKKQLQIKEAFSHLWTVYQTKAWGHDVITEDDEYADYSGYCTTMIASIGTLFLMDMIPEVLEIERYLNKTVLTPKGTTNRATFIGQVVGGLISAYDLTGFHTFKEQFINIANKLSSPSSNPTSDTMIITKNGWIQSSNQIYNIHEYSSVILPMQKCYEYTNSKIFYSSSLGPIDELITTSRNSAVHQNLYNSTAKKEYIGLISYANDGNSLYEVIQKLNMLTNNAFNSLKKHTRDSTMIFLHKFIEEDKEGNDFVIRYKGTKKDPTVTIDSSLFAGMLLLNKDLPSEYTNTVINITKKLGNGIIKYLNINENGIPPVAAKLDSDGKLTPVVNRYYLDHRILESLLILYRTTHDQKYRDAAWKLFLSVNATCRTNYGFTGVSMKPNGEHETLEGEIDPRIFSGFFKYMYLIFSDSAFVDLDNWIFTPEGHPILKLDKKLLTADSEVFTNGDRTSVFQ